MKDHPILFSGLMVRANLDGLKTQTRRILKPQPSFQDSIFHGYFGVDGTKALFVSHSNTHRDTIRVPFSIGDRLWVREAHALLPRTAYRGSIGTGTIQQVEHPTDGYTAAVFREGFDRSGAPLWRPSIHMPRWASRLTLIITDVRVQRLQDISEEDAIAEGVVKVRDACHVIRGFDYDLSGLCHTSAITPFQKLWDHINGPGAWEANPWVVAYSYRPIFQNIDKIEVAA